MKGGRAVEHLGWVLGPSVLVAVRAAADIARECARRRTKVALLGGTKPGSCTIDRRDGDVFLADAMPGGSEHPPELR